MDEGVDNKANLLCGCMPFYRRLRQQSSKAPCATEVVIAPVQTPVIPDSALQPLSSGGVEFVDTGQPSEPAIPSRETPTEPRLRRLQAPQSQAELLSCVTSLEITFGPRVSPLIPLDTAPSIEDTSKYASARPSHADNPKQLPTPITSSDTGDISTSQPYPNAPLLQLQPRTQPNLPSDGATARVIHLAAYRCASSFGITPRKPSLLGRPQLLPITDRPPSGTLPRDPSETGSFALGQSNTGVVELSSAQILPTLQPDAVAAAIHPQATPSAPLVRRLSFSRISIGLPQPASGVGSAPNTLTITGTLDGPGQQQDIMLTSMMTCDSIGALPLGGAAACVRADKGASAMPGGSGRGAASADGGGDGGAARGGEGPGGTDRSGGGEGGGGGRGMLCLSGEFPRFQSLQGGGLSHLLNSDTGAISTSAIEQLRQQVVQEQQQGGLAGQPIEVDNLEQVGQGSFGVVYRGVWQGAAVAIKYLVASSTQQLQISATEALLSKLLAHPNVVQTFACKVVKLTSVYFACPETSLANDLEGSDYASDDDGGWTFGGIRAGGKQPLGAAPPASKVGTPPSHTQLCAAGVGASNGDLATCASAGPCVDSRHQQVRSVEVSSHRYPDGCTTTARSVSCPTPPSAAAQQERQQDQQPSIARRSSGSGPGPPAARVQPTAGTVGVVPCPALSTAATTFCPGAAPEPVADLAPPHGAADAHSAGRTSSAPVNGCRSCGGERPNDTMRPEEDDGPEPKGEARAPGQSPSVAGFVAGLEPGGKKPPSLDTVAWPDRGWLAARGRHPDAPHASPGNPGDDASPQGPPLRPGVHGLLHAAAADTHLGLDSFHSGDGFGAPYLGDECTSRPSPLPLSKYRELLGQIRAQPGDFLTQIIMEYCDRGSLQRAIDKQLFRASSRWSARVALRAMLRTAREVAQGMCHLHASQIIHGDLKPANVLLKSSRSDRRGFVAKVADFGLSKILHLGAHSSLNCGSEATGTLAYMAPEVLGGSLSPAADVYSFGVILWQLVTGERPFADVHPGHLFLGVCGGTLRLEWPTETNPLVQKLGEACLAFEKRQRPSFTKVARTLGVIETVVRNEGAVQAAAAAAAAAAVGPAALPSTLLRESYGVVGLMGGQTAPALVTPVLSPISGSGTGEVTGLVCGSAAAPRMLRHVLLPSSRVQMDGLPPASGMQMPPGTPPLIQMPMRGPLLASCNHTGYGAAITTASCGCNGTGSICGSTGAHHSATAQSCMVLHGVASTAAATGNGALFGGGHLSHPGYGPLVALPAAMCGTESDGVTTGPKPSCMTGTAGLLVDGLTAPTLRVSSIHRPDSSGGGGGGSLRQQLVSCTNVAAGGGIGGLVSVDFGLLGAASMIPHRPDSMPCGVAAPNAARTSGPAWSSVDRPDSQPHISFPHAALSYCVPYPCQVDPTGQAQHVEAAYPCARPGAAMMGIAPSTSTSPSCSPHKQHQPPQQLPMRANVAPSVPPIDQVLPAFASSCGGGGGNFFMGAGGEYMACVTPQDVLQTQLQPPHQHTQQQQQLLQLQFQALQQHLLQQDPQQQQIHLSFQQQLAPFHPQEQQLLTQVQCQQETQHRSPMTPPGGGANTQAAPPAQIASSQAVDSTPVGMLAPPLQLPQSPPGMLWVVPSHVPVFATAALGTPEAAAMESYQPPPALSQHYHPALQPVASTNPLYPLMAPKSSPVSASVGSGPTASPSNPEQVHPGPMGTLPQQPAAYVRPYLNGALPYLHSPCFSAGPNSVPLLGKQGEEAVAAAVAAINATVVSTLPSPHPPTAVDPTGASPPPAIRLSAQAPHPAIQPHFGTGVPSYFLPCMPHLGPAPAQPVTTQVLGPSELSCTTEVAATATATITATSIASATATTIASPTVVTHDGNALGQTAMPLPATAAASSPSSSQEKVRNGTLSKFISTAGATAITASQLHPLTSSSTRAAGSPPQLNCWLAGAAFNRSTSCNHHISGTLPNATTAATTAATVISTTAAKGGLRAPIPFPPPGQPLDLRPVLKTTSVVNGSGYTSQISGSPPTGSNTATSLASATVPAGESYGLYQIPYGMVSSGSPMQYRDKDCGGWPPPGLRRDAIMEGDEEGL